MGRNTCRIVGDGIASQKRNPEYLLIFIGSKTTFIDERIQFAILSKKLTSLFYGKNHYSNSVKSNEGVIYEGSGSSPTTSQSKDLIEGSGLPESFSDDEDDDYPNEINLESIEDSNNYNNYNSNNILDDSISKNALPSSSGFC